MGFLSECGTHEGYLVGLVFDDAGWYSGHAGYETLREAPAPHPTSGRMRELGRGNMHELGDKQEAEGVIHTHLSLRLESVGRRMQFVGQGLPVAFGKMACSCGWRSPLLRLPRGSFWAPSSLFTPEAFEDKAVQLWQRHVLESGAATDGGCNVDVLLAAARAAGGVR